MASPELPELVVADAAAWRSWLDQHHAQPTGVWLVLAKKGHTEPTSLTYAAALEEALCYGWIDGQVQRRDERTYRQRFTPRRARSQWSKNNVALAGRLIDEGRMTPAGQAEIDRAQADGRWDAAYAGSATIEVPPDLQAALDANPDAARTFAGLDSRNRYAILYRLTTVKRADTRARKIREATDMLAAGEAFYPQASRRPGGPSN